jgi:dihydroorotate dehydrogenase (fumarate)
LKDRSRAATCGGGCIAIGPHPSHVNLATSYLGLSLRSPFVVGASPCCDDVDAAERLQDAGAAAVVLRSLFEEQVAEGLPGALAHAPIQTAYSEFADYQVLPDEYLRHIERLKRRLSIPVIASLNGHHPGPWIDFAGQLERAGADAIELNFYQVVTDPAIAADQVELEMLEVVTSVSGSVGLPVAVKLSPYHASVAQVAVALELAGAAGLVLFNRFYQPDINIDTFDVDPVLRLSDPGELLLRLRWLAIISPLIRGSLAATGGVHTSAGVVKAIMTGAHVVQLVSALLKHGPETITGLRAGLEAWMRQHGYATLDEFRGMLNHRRCGDTTTYERANYIRVLQSWKI